ncbi:hypothetical protein HR12_23500 [Microbacterium sp. SUBG005]|nr:hypothetical protein HR12_40030 [Microbacterium sp. SUBG005]KEP75776.1 hypothetical protein HR12_23500 [Microbacterium sp. SUBG005]
MAGLLCAADASDESGHASASEWDTCVVERVAGVADECFYGLRFGHGLFPSVDVTEFIGVAGLGGVGVHLTTSGSQPMTQ